MHAKVLIMFIFYPHTKIMIMLINKKIQNIKDTFLKCTIYENMSEQQIKVFAILENDD